jgi:hypothetical protein
VAEGRPKMNPTSKNRQFLKLLFANDQVTKSNADDHWQKAVYKINNLMTEHVLPNIFDVFLTVHHIIHLSHLPTLMHNSFIH